MREDLNNIPEDESVEEISARLKLNKKHSQIRDVIRALIITVFLHGTGMELLGRYGLNSYIEGYQSIGELQDDLEAKIMSDPNYLRKINLGEFFIDVDEANGLINKAEKENALNVFNQKVKQLSSYRNDPYVLLHEISQMMGRYVPNRRGMSNIYLNVFVNGITTEVNKNFIILEFEMSLYKFIPYNFIPFPNNRNIFSYVKNIQPK